MDAVSPRDLRTRATDFASLWRCNFCGTLDPTCYDLHTATVCLQIGVPLQVRFMKLTSTSIRSQTKPSSHIVRRGVQRCWGGGGTEIERATHRRRCHLRYGMLPNPGVREDRTPFKFASRKDTCCASIGPGRQLEAREDESHPAAGTCTTRSKHINYVNHGMYRRGAKADSE